MVHLPVHACLIFHLDRRIRTGIHRHQLRLYGDQQLVQASQKRRLGWISFSIPFGIGLAFLLLTEEIQRRQTSQNIGELETWQVCVLP